MTTKESSHLLNMIIDLGINVFEVGAVYRDTEEWIGRVLPKRRRDKLFISSKSTKITKEGLLKELEVSLVKLNTDYVDCYMLHDYSSLLHYERVMAEGGAFEGLKQAQKEGKTRFIGITGHSCPVMMAALRSGEFDIYVIPYNAAHREFGRALNLAAKLGAAVFAMKPYGGNGLLKYDPENPRQLPQTLTPEQCLRYVLSHPGATIAIPNMGTPEHVKQALAAAATYRPLNSNERSAIEAKAARIIGGVCSECKEKPCEKACPNEVPISQIISWYQEMFRLGYDHRHHGDMYAVLEHDFWDCDGCGRCEKVCPQKFDIRTDLEKYDRRYSEARARDVYRYDKIHR